MAKSGTLMSTANKMKSMSTSGVRHGPSVKHVTTHADRKGVKGSGVSGATTSPLKGPDRGGVK